METGEIEEREYNPSKRDYPIVIKIVLIFFIISSTINLLTQFTNNLLWISPAFTAIQLIGGIINLIAFILIYNKNISGVYIYVAMMFLQIPMNMILVQSDLTPIFISSIFRLSILSLIIFIPAKGVSVYNIMMYRKKYKYDIANEEHEKKIEEKNEKTASVNSIESEKEIRKEVEEEIEDFESKKIIDKLTEREKIELVEEDKILNIKNEETNTDERKEDKLNKDTDEPIKKNNRIDSKKTLLIKRILVAIIAIFIIVGSVIAMKVAKDDYPEFVSSPLDKFKHHYSMANNKLFKSLMKNGEEAISNDLDVLGRKYMDEAFEVKTNKINNIMALADYYNDQEKYELVDSLYRRGVIIDKRNSELYYLLAKNLLNIKINNKYKNNDEDILYYSQMALTLDSNHSSAILLLTKYYLLFGNTKDLKLWAQKYIDVEPEEYYGYLYLAKGLYDEGNKEKAIALYNKALRFNTYNTINYGQFSYLGGAPMNVLSMSVANSTNGVYGSKVYAKDACYLSLKAKMQVLREGVHCIDIKLYENERLCTSTKSPYGYTLDKEINISPATVKMMFEFSLGGWGYETPGNWSVGDYRYEIWHAGELLGTKSFKLY